MRVHILGICGTFMGGIAVIAQELGWEVEGSDEQVYPPMSTQLQQQGITLKQGYAEPFFGAGVDEIVVGNVMRRGMPVVEHLLNEQLRFMSGPAWLARHVLHKRHVLAVSGTHGKTTTASMLAWILECAGLEPGFLIGGVCPDLGCSARLGKAPYFVIEADEYDTAFFDKRSKFIHYRPRTLVINNIEFDHADIFTNLEQIQTQFHYLLRTVPGQGLIIYPEADVNVQNVLQRGVWTPQASIGEGQGDWQVKLLDPAGQTLQISHGESSQTFTWSLVGRHNALNALAAVTAAHHVGVSLASSIAALARFQGVKRRLEIRGTQRNITVYDDFAHHPTAIATTLAGLRAKVGDKARVIAVLELRSNSMRTGHHQDQLGSAFAAADAVYLFKPAEASWGVEAVWSQTGKPGGVYQDLTDLLSELHQQLLPGDHVVLMSNGGFGGLHEQLLARLAA